MSKKTEKDNSPGLEVELYPDGWPIDTLKLFPLALERYGEEYLERAVRSCLRNSERIAHSDTCFCFYCGYRFDPRVQVPDISTYPDGGLGTGICPLCGIDALLCSVDGYPFTDPVFIAGMAEYGFNGYCPIADGKPIKPISWTPIVVD